MSRAREWTLRCRYELEQHSQAAFITLTYDRESLPPTLQKRDLQLFNKRLRRAAGPFRFFASGEYGETNGRPHYHSIAFGIDARERDLIEATWGLGRTHAVPVTPAAVAYVAGYTAKKVGWRLDAADERIDPDTGEVYHWQPPFILMSRRPGIGGHLRQYPQSWRLHAVLDGQKLPVPRFLHEAWKKQSTPEQREDLAYEKSLLAKKVTSERLKAAEQIALSKQALQGARRKL